ncbi:hypothetical protein KDH_13610 [Dictyobacter sp. S3.2.2.5]|uniref:histidine kinase n=1 Tax=Dictyobacter halimunensis TaxID=3026934 RepID=A0ABQ6FQ21_9CHLR|nr:hypothetical protein KDH_13610 [Dictyobacter sp. S3.2.2.5]
MSLEHGCTEIESDAQIREARSRTNLSGTPLRLARITWLVVALLILVLFCIRLPFTYADSFIICRSGDCLQSGRLTLEKVQEVQSLGMSVQLYATIFIFVSLIILQLGYIFIGIFIFWRAWHKNHEPIVLITSLALISFGGIFSAFDPVTPLPPFVHGLSLIMSFLGNCCIGLFFYLFPGGRFEPRWTRWLALAWIIYWAINNLLLNSFLSSNGMVGFLFLPLVGSAIAVQVYRYLRISTPAQRQQTKWVVFGLSLALGGFIASLLILTTFPFGMTFGNVLLYAFLLALPVSIAIAVLRSHLWDIDILINRTLVYIALTACVVLVYILVVVLLGTVLQTSGNLFISLLATGLVAVIFQPLRLRLQAAVNRLMFGERDTPYTVISRLGQRLEATLAVDAILPTIVETVAQALKLPYAAITLKQQEEFVTVAAYGSPRTQLTVLPLVYRTESIGELILAQRAEGEDFSIADRMLLDELARQAGAAAHAVQLTQDLQRLTGELQQSRTQLVTAREEERRRLRRDLHDGLGSALTSITFQLDAAYNLLETDPQTVKSLLRELKIQAQTSISDIRQLVYNLRPPILDEWGLPGALREQVAQYQLNNVQVVVEVNEPLPPLPAAVEVAAYRIAMEALSNVIRHAQASFCTIHLSICDQALLVEVQDNGQGLPQKYRAGVGIHAMHERAAEIGGTCAITPIATGGIRVLASLPLVKE